MALKTAAKIRKAAGKAAAKSAPQTWGGLVGTADGTIEVPGHPELWYVRPVDGSLPVVVIGGGAPKLGNFPVRVGADYYDRRIRRIVGIDYARLPSGTVSEVQTIGNHATSHAYGGSDPVYLSTNQLTELLVYASSGMNVTVNAGNIAVAGAPVAVTKTIVDMTSHVPVSGAVYCLIRVNSSGVVSVQDGTPVTEYTALGYGDIPTVAAGYVMLAFVRLYAGQTALSRALNDQDVVDCRFIGASVGASSIHHATHENGGSDEISVTGLSGLLADGQTPLAHKTSHEDDGADEISVAGLSGVLADPQTPAAHKASHENSGGDEISVAGLSGVLADRQDADHIQGVDVDSAAPSNGQALIYSGGSSRYVPTTPGPYLTEQFVGTVLLDETAAAGGQAAFTLDPVGSGWAWIEIILDGFTERAATTDGIYLTFNDDTTNTNYRAPYNSNGSAAAAGVDDVRYLGTLPGSTNTDVTGLIRAIIPNPGGALRKDWLSTSTRRESATGSYVAERGGQWESTAAIAKISLTSSGGADFAEGTRCIIIGYKNQLIGAGEFLKLDASNGPLTGDLGLASGKVLKVNSVQVVGTQGAVIADAKTDYTTGDLDTEAEIITAINATNTTLNAILARLRAHGLIAT